MALSCIIFEIKRDIGRTSWFFHTSLHSTPPLSRGLRRNIAVPFSMDFKNLQFLSCGLCRHAVLLPQTKFRRNRIIGRWVMAKKRFSRWRPLPSWIPKISIFGHVTVTGFNIWCSVPNFIKIGRFFTEIWRFNDYQNGGPPPSWILKICSFCHAAFVGMPFCFRVQNFAEIGQLVDELWLKKRFSRWRSPPS